MPCCGFPCPLAGGGQHHQAYPLLIRSRGRAAVALMVDNIEMGQETLAGKGFSMITEADLMELIGE